VWVFYGQKAAYVGVFSKGFYNWTKNKYSLRSAVPVGGLV